ncbi:MAG: hypothetical protein N4A71_19370 [Carboxylicivirga sp.]|jgi:hypothetical protein|nr:hypothetical protein [Carboxylicivirga sp.]
MKNKGLLISIILLIGIFVPFVTYLHVVQMFYLLIPYAVIILVSIIYLIISFFNKEKNSWEIAFKTSLLPIFIVSQLLSVITVDRIQLIRSKKVIKFVEKKIKADGVTPEIIDIGLGIEYKKSERGNDFEIRYSRGFLVTERYDSNTKKWKSYGWND